MEHEMETALVHWGNIGVIEKLKLLFRVWGGVWV